MADLFSKFRTVLDSPLKNGFAITPNNTTDLAFTTRAILVGTSGNVNLIFEGDIDPVVVYMVAGVLYPFRVKRVLATSTSATGIDGFY